LGIRKIDISDEMLEHLKCIVQPIVS